ncbi:hypothetical protein [Streptomyces mirabilis]|uniref:hypothetical protein n=1 Tax=Streptomyces mirabilis TaxID=68239 RepID=UPI0036C20A63
MKWSPTGWGAEITGETGDYTVPVEKWGAKNEALVADPDKAKLVPATELKGFKRLVEHHRVVAVVPAGPGWTVESDRFGPFPGYSAAIGAWVMDGEGHFWPVIGASEPPDGGPSRPSSKGESVLRPHWDSGITIVPPSLD